MINNPLKVLIVGAGNIGAFYDAPESADILTHAHAVVQSENFELIGFYDVDFDKAKQAANLWDTCWYESIDEALSKHRADIAVVAVPDKYHYEMMQTLRTKDIKLILLEKPIGMTIDEAACIVDLYNNSNIKVLVNYSRRFIPEYKEIRKEIVASKWGKLLAGTIYYGKGLFHNGSHAVDLLRMLLGEFEILLSYGEIADYSDDDKSIYAILQHSDGGIINLCPIDHKKYDIFEIDLLFEEGRIRVVNSGADCEIFTLEENLEYQGYKNLKLLERRRIKMNMALNFAYLNIYNSLIEDGDLFSKLSEAYRTFELCNRIKES